jgi:alpha-mannosidase
VATELEAIIGQAIKTLAGEGDAPLVFNAAPHPRNGVPALGAWSRSSGAASTVTPDGHGYLLDNGRLQVSIDSRGLLTSVLDGDREVLAPGSVGNLLQLHPDTPNVYDAWDIDAFYRNVATDLTDADVSTVDGGVRVTRRIGDSTITQIITLDGGTVVFDTDIDWHEREKLLKAGFDLDVTADRSASEIQFGHVFRPTHSNTSWDAAKFEICAHRFVQVAEPGYGVAVVNDSTYGHDVTRRPRTGGGTTTVVRLSLLRAPRSPDPETDQGQHSLRYALVPGAGIIDAAREGYRINLPEREAVGGGSVEPLVTVDADGVIVESVKLADDRSGDVVVRVYEALGARAAATMRLGFPVTRADVVDLLERPTASAELGDQEIGLTLRPFQILTLRFARG